MERLRRGWYNPKSMRYGIILFLTVAVALTVPLAETGLLANFGIFVLVLTLVLMAPILLSTKFGKLFVRHFFRKRFGFKPSKVSGMKGAEQRAVDQALHLLAVELDECFTKENMSLSQPVGQLKKDRITVTTLKERERKLRSVARLVKKAKRAFWDSNALAKGLGYEVEKQYIDYLKS